MKYYRITGMNEGVLIKPFAVSEDSLDDAIAEHGDMCRCYEEITRSEYDEIRNTTDEEDLSEYDINDVLLDVLLEADLDQHEYEVEPIEVEPTFNDVILLLMSRRWAFEVINYLYVSKDDELVINQQLKAPHVGKDILVLYFVVGNREFFLHEFDENAVIEYFHEIKNWC